MASEDKTLDKRVREWLTTEGYPLEMSVARILHKAGLFVYQSDYYEDTSTGKQREIDVVALDYVHVGGFEARLALCVECKKSPGKPWVLLTSSERKLHGSFGVLERAASRHASKALSRFAVKKEFQQLDIFRFPERPAFGVVQAWSDSSKDPAYEACMQACKAALSEVSLADKYSESLFPVLDIAFPVVVFDGKLFEAYLSGSDDVEVAEVTRGTLVWRNPIMGMPHAIINIVTVDGLDWIISALKQASALIESAKDTIKTVLDEQMRKNLPNEEPWA